jgi:hypothetical protein
MKDQDRFSWKAEWKAAGLDPGPLTEAEEAQVPRLQEENREFLIKHPPQKTLRRRRSVPFSVWAGGLAAAAVVLVFLLPGSPFSTGVNSLERVKGSGEPLVAVYRHGSTGVEKLASGSMVSAGDVLQVAYKVSRPLQGALLSLDGDGNVTVHLAKDGHSVALVPGGERHLDFSYELDKAPRFEAFFLFTSDQSFDLEPVRQRLKAVSTWDALAPETFGPALRFTVLGLTKATR